MDAPRFYVREPLAPGARIDLPAPVTRHAVRVLRLATGTRVTLFDGRGGEYPAVLEYVDRDYAYATVGAWDERECESPLSITLVQAVQAGDKMDYTIQKAVELGVHAIVPLESRRSVIRLAGERAAKRVAHWQGVVASACEQCGRNRLPLVSPLETVEKWLARPPGGALRLMLAPGAERSLAEIAPATQVELLVGAEGGLDERELVAAQLAGFTAIRLGPRILRTETAGLAALSALQTLWGDFQREVHDV